MKITNCKYFIIILCIFFSGAVVISAQSTAQEIETLLETSAVSYAQAARFLLDASGKFITMDQNEAFRYAEERGWLPRNVQAYQNARLDGISKLLMNVFDISGGLLYRITKSPHYAYRELVYRNVIQGRTSPSMNVPGELLLFMTTRLITNRDRDNPTGEEELAAENAAREAVRQQQLTLENAAREEAARREQELAEQTAREEAARQEQLAAENAAREEALRLEQERLAAENAAREEAARREQELAEQAAIEEAARLEQLAADEEALHLEQERLAAENAAREEAARIEQELAEQAALEEAARLELELAAMDDAARLERELAEQAALEEAARQQQIALENTAREEAARIERELADQAALEEAARLELELAAMDDATRLERELAEQAAREAAARQQQLDADEEAAREEAARYERELAEQAARQEQIAADDEAARREEELAAENAAREEIFREIAARDPGSIVFPNIQFEPDLWELTAAERIKLQEAADILRNIPNVRLEIAGHSALAKTVEGQLMVSQERARVVADYLVSLGVCSAENITTIGYGSTRPVATNSTEAGMAANRRAEITILGGQ